jgi:hypothetical protein
MSDVAQEVGAILQPEKESFAFRRRRMSIQSEAFG